MNEQNKQHESYWDVLKRQEHVKTNGADTLPDSTDEPLAVDVRRYQAAAISNPPRTEETLTLIFDAGRGMSKRYAYLTDILFDCAAPEGDWIALIYTQHVVTIEGHNLMALVPLLDDAVCQFLIVYQPEHYDPPADDEPVILGMGLESVERVMGKLMGNEDADDDANDV